MVMVMGSRNAMVGSGKRKIRQLQHDLKFNYSFLQRDWIVLLALETNDDDVLQKSGEKYTLLR